jgi:hypothetical protein
LSITGELPGGTRVPPGIPESVSHPICMKKKLLLVFTLLATVCAPSATHAAADYPLKKCIVTGDAFGGDLGEPIKITYKGRQILLCCKSCVRKFNKEPEKYLAILDKEIAKRK